MRDNPDYALTDPELAKAVIRSSPWATMVSHTENGLIASHYPFLLDEETDDIVILSHVGRPDDELHSLGNTELLVIFEGANGYVSPGWYGTSPAVPTWNFATVHAYGVPEILSTEANLLVLERLVDRFEMPLPQPFRMRHSPENVEYVNRIVNGTVGFSMRVTRFVGKNKMSQDKPEEAFDRVVQQLHKPGPYHNPSLANHMLTNPSIDE